MDNTLEYCVQLLLKSYKDVLVGFNEKFEKAGNMSEKCFYTGVITSLETVIEDLECLLK